MANQILFAHCEEILTGSVEMAHAEFGIEDKDRRGQQVQSGKSGTDGSHGGILRPEGGMGLAEAVAQGKASQRRLESSLLIA